MLNKSDINQIDKIFSKRLKSVKEDITKIRNDTKTIVNFFDNEYLELRKRVERIEDHLNLPPFS